MRKCAVDDHEIEICSKYFDEKCYKAELERIDLDIDHEFDCCEHFCTIGWHEGLDPCRWFSVNHYISEYSDIKKSQINPFYHYLVTGEQEGRTPCPYKDSGDAKIKILKPLTTLSDEAKTWRRDLNKCNTLGEIELGKRIDEIVKEHNFLAVLSVSNDNYIESPGGIQICINREKESFLGTGVNYVHIFPAQPMPKLNYKGSSIQIVGVSLNGIFIGNTYTSTISRLLFKRADLKCVILHSVLGFNLSLLTVTIKQLRPEKVLYWAHDFFPFCPSWTLMRNKIEYCDAPPQESSMCNLCYFGEERAAHISVFREFFSHIDVSVICPSFDVKVRYERFLDFNGYRISSIDTFRHIDLVNLSSANRDPNGRLRIAFLGHPSYHKGWEQYLKLFHSRKLANNFDFYHFGSYDSKVGHGIVYVHVNSSVEGEDAMVEAIRTNRIDFCFLWSLWPETFGITSVEAVMGGARIVSNFLSGNVTDFARNSGYGNIFADIDSVINWLQNISITPDFFKTLSFPLNVSVRKSQLSYEFLVKNFSEKYR